MVRRHRLLETFLVERLGYSWDEVHDEAENLEHAASDMFIDRIEADLGFPAHDPHGDVIPNRDGSMVTTPARALAQVEPDSCGRDRKSTRLNSSHVAISYAVFCLKKKKKNSQE